MFSFSEVEIHMIFGVGKVSCLERSPHFRSVPGYKVMSGPYFRRIQVGVFLGSNTYGEAPL